MISFAVNQQAGKRISAKFWRQWLKKIARTLKLRKKLEISIAVVGAETIKELNRVYRGQNQVTDVLSFGELDKAIEFTADSKNYLGEIIICYPQAVRQAKRVGHSVNQELELLLIHGFLHLLGYNHEKTREAKVMRELEQRILS